MTQNDFGKIREIIQEFFDISGLAVEVNVGPLQDLTIPINLKMEEPQALIGEGGQTLLEVQRLLKIILKKRIDVGTTFYVDLDINDYKKKKTEYLKEVARTTADQVSLTKKEIKLSPMPSHERRIIHLELTSRSDVATESVGQEPERTVVIRPSRP